MWQDLEKSEESEGVGGGDPDNEPDSAGADGRDVEEQLHRPAALGPGAYQGLHDGSYCEYSNFRKYAHPLHVKEGIITEKVFPVFSESLFGLVLA